MTSSIIESLATTSCLCRTPTAHDKVLNSECCYSFHTPYHTGGLLVHLQHWIGVAPLLVNKNEDGLYVRICHERRCVKSDNTNDKKVENADTKVLGIGVPGGFDTDETKYETVATHTIVAYQNGQIAQEEPYNDTTKSTNFPESVQKAADAVICHAGLTTQQAVTSWKLDAEDIPVSKYAATLPFVDNHVVISPNPADWKCAKSGDTENLWLNLSDGYIGGGRQNWDGSGGSNGALDHFNETNQQYPLVVKLGTITSDVVNTADCYSYAPDEDGPVKIPNLQELLQKRGIRAGGMQKTVKSTAELEVELNANYAFDAITEAGASLTPMSGPHYQGLANLGNSCYMNSILQLLLDLPELAHRYGTTNVKTLEKQTLQQDVTPTAAPNDLLCQTAKIASAITSGLFAKPLTNDDKDDNDDDNNDKDDPNHPQYRLTPRMFKHLIGKDHVDFCTEQQQDAAQFLQYFLEQLDRAELKKKALKTAQTTATMTSSHLFSFAHHQRLVCGADQKIKYKTTQVPAETVWSLRIPMELATTTTTSPAKVEAGMASPEQKRLKSGGDDNNEKAKKEDKEEDDPIPTIPLTTCIEEWAKEHTVEGLRWPHLHNASHPALQTARFGNFPRYLLVQLQRYELGPDWQPVKLKVGLTLPENAELDLTAYAATGPQEGEDLVPPEDETTQSAAPAAAVALDEAALGQLMDMGFSLNACKRALTAVGGSNVEAAMTWFFEHNTDSDFNDPLPDNAAAAASSSSSVVDEGVVQSLVASLGCFTADQVRAVLQETGGAADRAADWLFSHMDDLDAAIAGLSSSASAGASDTTKTETKLEDGPGKYTLVGMVSHIGKHTGSGHYVAHIKKNDQWVIFNDEKVALSADPPFAHAYLYLFQRTDTIGKPHGEY